jgi:hypothetical protein
MGVKGNELLLYIAASIPKVRGSPGYIFRENLEGYSPCSRL